MAKDTQIRVPKKLPERIGETLINAKSRDGIAATAAELLSEIFDYIESPTGDLKLLKKANSLREQLHSAKASIPNSAAPALEDRVAALEKALAKYEDAPKKKQAARTKRAA